MRTHNNRGSALIWALLSVLVLSIILAAGLMMTSASFNAANEQHTGRQAYFTAMSLTKTYAGWIQDTSMSTPNPPSQGDRDTFMESLKNGTIRLAFSEADLGDNMGACEVEISYLNADHRSLQITSTAIYLGQEATVVATLTGTGSLAPLHHFPTTDFSTAVYDKEAAALNNLSVGVPINVFGNKGTGTGVRVNGFDGNVSVKRNYNAENQAYIDSQINASSDREVTWLETVWTVGDNAFSGSRDMPYIGESIFENQQAPFASARVVTPKNGRFVFNPVNRPPPSNTGYSSSPTALWNTKYAGFDIDDTDGKDVRIRLANASNLQKRTGTNIPLNAIVSFDFTDNRYSNALDANGNYNDRTGSKTVGRGANQMRYWPNKWKSLRIYTRNVADDKINSNLMFGPYGRVHSGSTLDYRGWGHYRNNHKGGKGEYWDYCSKILSPGDLNSTHYVDVKDNTGLPYLSVEWGDNVGIYILDDTDKYVRFLQGVNLMNGTIYSMRDTIIGGALVYRTNSYHFDDINNGAAGFSGEPHNYTLYPTFTCTQHQVISDMDIVLLAPVGKTRNSVIRHPDSWKNFEGRKLTIDGGNIYVGARQTLTIQSEVKDGLAVKGLVNPQGSAMAGTWGASTFRDYTENGNMMDIAPKQIVVDTGGTLTIMGNQNNRTNVNTDIYVKGTLNIQANAKIRGNIYVYGGGHLNIEGAFSVQDPNANANDPNADDSGIFIYGNDTLGADGNPAGAGTITLPAGLTSLTSGKLHLINRALSGQIDAGLLCNKRNARTGVCEHFNTPNAGKPAQWEIQYADS